MQMCENRARARDGIEYESKSNPDKVYKAYAFRADELPMCTCFAFLTGRKKEAKRLGVATNDISYHCSHLKDLYAHVCTWHEDDPTDGGLQVNGRCPRCGSPTVDDDEEIDDPMARLLALRAENQPPPPPKPRPVITADVRGADTATVTAEIAIDGVPVAGVIWDEEATNDPTIVIWNADGDAVYTIPWRDIARSAPTGDAVATASAMLAQLS